MQVSGMPMLVRWLCLSWCPQNGVPMCHQQSRPRKQSKPVRKQSPRDSKTTSHWTQAHSKGKDELQGTFGYIQPGFLWSASKSPILLEVIHPALILGRLVVRGTVVLLTQQVFKKQPRVPSLALIFLLPHRMTLAIHCDASATRCPLKCEKTCAS